MVDAHAREADARDRRDRPCCRIFRVGRQRRGDGAKPRQGAGAGHGEPHWHRGRPQGIQGRAGLPPQHRYANPLHGLHQCGQVQSGGAPARQLRNQRPGERARIGRAETGDQGRRSPPGEAVDAGRVECRSLPERRAGAGPRADASELRRGLSARSWKAGHGRGVHDLPRRELRSDEAEECRRLAGGHRPDDGQGQLRWRPGQLVRRYPRSASHEFPVRVPGSERPARVP